MSTVKKHNITQAGISPTLAINQLSNQMEALGQAVFRFGFGQSPFPVPLEVQQSLQANAFQKAYLPSTGLEDLRKAVARYYHNRTNISFTKDQVIIGPGSKELIFLCQLSYPATLLLPAPSWVSYAPQAKMLSREVLWMETKKEDKYLLDPDEFENYCRGASGKNKMLILNYPNNPTGTTFSGSQLETLAAIARRYKVLIISDEIYGALNHSAPHISIANYYPEGTIITGGLSKWCGAGGWRLGVALFPKEQQALKNKLTANASETFSCVSAPIQYAAVKAYEGSAAIERYLRHENEILNKVGHYVARRLQAGQVHCPHPQGGFYVFIDFSSFQEKLALRNIRTSNELCTRLLQEAGVALLPGTAFGVPENELKARLAYVNFDGEKALHWWKKNNGITEEDSFIKNCCPKIEQGVSELLKWVQN